MRTFIHHKTDDFETKTKLIKTIFMDNLESKLHLIHDIINQTVEKLKHYKQDFKEKWIIKWRIYNIHSKKVKRIWNLKWNPCRKILDRKSNRYIK